MSIAVFYYNIFSFTFNHTKIKMRLQCFVLLCMNWCYYISYTFKSLKNAAAVRQQQFVIYWKITGLIKFYVEQLEFGLGSDLMRKRFWKCALWACTNYVKMGKRSVDLVWNDRKYLRMYPILKTFQLTDFPGISDE